MSEERVGMNVRAADDRAELGREAA
jgi:hypothetical protein